MIHIPRELHQKLEEKASKVAFLGYQPKFFNPISKQMIVSFDAVFLDDRFMESDDWHEDGCGQTSCVDPIVLFTERI